MELLSTRANTPSLIPAEPDLARRGLLMSLIAIAFLNRLDRGPEAVSIRRQALLAMSSCCKSHARWLETSERVPVLEAQVFTSALMRFEEMLNAATGDPEVLSPVEKRIWTIAQLSCLLRGFCWRCILDDSAPAHCEIVYTRSLQKAVEEVLATPGLA